MELACCNQTSGCLYVLSCCGTQKWARFQSFLSTCFRSELSDSSPFLRCNAVSASRRLYQRGMGTSSISPGKASLATSSCTVRTRRWRSAAAASLAAEFGRLSLPRAQCRPTTLSKQQHAQPIPPCAARHHNRTCSLVCRVHMRAPPTFPPDPTYTHPHIHEILPPLPAVGLQWGCSGVAMRCGGHAQ